MRIRIDIDALTTGDAEYSTSRHVDVDNPKCKDCMDQLIDDTRNDFETFGEIVFRIQYNNQTIWQAKGQS